jgi:hypothetical protein
LRFVQGDEEFFPREYIWDMGTNLLPHYANNWPISEGPYNDNFPDRIRKNFLDLLEHRFGPKGEITKACYMMGTEIPTDQHMNRIIDLIGESLVLFKDYMNKLIDESPPD